MAPLLTETMAGVIQGFFRRALPTVLLMLTAWLLLAPAPGIAQLGRTPEVSGVRFGLNENATRIVIDLDRRARFATHILADPPRLVVELENVRWRVREQPESRPRGIARSAAYGHLDAGRSRLVVDVGEPFRVLRQEHLPPSGSIRHHRILVDIAPLPRSAPAAPATAESAAIARTLAVLTPPRPKPGGPQPGVSTATLAAIDAILNPESTSADGADGAAAPADNSADGAVMAGLPLPSIRPPSPAPPARPVIAIDPGHGGADPGTIGINGVYEKRVTLDVARRLRDLLQVTDRYEVVMTRDSDVYVSLRDRMETARRAGAALFISIHADSLGDSGFRGASVYTLSDQASDAEAGLLAAKENRADIIANTDLSAHDEIVAGILIDLAQRITNNRSIEFADLLADELSEITRLVRNTRRFAGFVVLKSPDVPSVLLELGYLSNPTDAANLTDPAYQTRLAQAAVRAIDRHFAAIAAAL